MQISNETIYALLKEFKDDTTTHLSKLNGQVQKNTEFRFKIMGGFAVVTAIGVTSIIGVVLLFFKIALS